MNFLLSIFTAVPESNEIVLFFSWTSDIISILGNHVILSFLTHQHGIFYSPRSYLLQIWSPHIMGNKKISIDLKMHALSLWDWGWQIFY